MPTVIWKGTLATGARSPKPFEAQIVQREPGEGWVDDAWIERVEDGEKVSPVDIRAKAWLEALVAVARELAEERQRAAVLLELAVPKDAVADAVNEIEHEITFAVAQGQRVAVLPAEAWEPVQEALDAWKKATESFLRAQAGGGDERKGGVTADGELTAWREIALTLARMARRREQGLMDSSDAQQLAAARRRLADLGATVDGLLHPEVDRGWWGGGEQPEPGARAPRSYRVVSEDSGLDEILPAPKARAGEARSKASSFAQAHPGLHVEVWVGHGLPEVEWEIEPTLTYQSDGVIVRQVPNRSLEQRIRAAYLRVTGDKLGEYLKLSLLRAQLPAEDRECLDDELRAMQQRGIAVLYPIDDPQRIRPEDDTAAILVAGERRDLLCIKPRSGA